MKSSKT
jgi:hypothetical protein